MKYILKTSISAACLLSASYSPLVHSSSQPLLGEIMWVGYNFCPRGWAEASGQILPISSNTALFSLYGTTYGGDGRTTFALPDLRGRVAIHEGNGPGLDSYRLGSRGGNQSVSLTTSQLPSHTHGVSAVQANTVANQLAGDQSAPENRVHADGQRAAVYSDTPALGTDLVDMHSSSVKLSGNTDATGTNTDVDIRQPYLTLRACVAIVGIFPSRS